jgi:hypothetical protein
MAEHIMDHYKNTKIIGVFNGDDAWKKLVPIRYPQTRARACVRVRFKGVDMTHALLIVFLTPKTGTPKTIGIHFYPDDRNKVKSIKTETDDLWISSAPYEALKWPDVPKLIKKLVEAAT